MEYKSFKSIINVNTGEYSKTKCNHTKTEDLDKIIMSLSRLMTKNEKCKFIESHIDKIEDIEKPTRKKIVARRNITQIRGSKLLEYALPRRHALFIEK
jgi:hypothetical protein